MTAVLLTRRRRHALHAMTSFASLLSTKNGMVPAATSLLCLSLLRMSRGSSTACGRSSGKAATLSTSSRPKQPGNGLSSRSNGSLLVCLLAFLFPPPLQDGAPVEAAFVKDWRVYFFLVWALMSGIILFNVLIAMLNDKYMEVNERAMEWWHYNKTLYYCHTHVLFNKPLIKGLRSMFACCCSCCAERPTGLQ